jgi:hypothetical protein
MYQKYIGIHKAITAVITLLAMSVSQKAPIGMLLLHTKEATVLCKATHAVIVTITVFFS